MSAGISTTNTSKRLRDLLQHVDDDQLVLPEIQREFVWTRKAVKLLFDVVSRVADWTHERRRAGRQEPFGEHRLADW